MDRQTDKRATIKDVARVAGVSRSTTSRALTGNGYVAKEVAERVRSAADTLGYVPDASARSLKQQRSRILGIVVYELRNHFYADLVAGASSEARQAGYFVMVCDNNGEPDGDRSAAATFMALRVDGVVTTPVTAELGTTLTRNGIPVIEVDRRFAPGSSDSVTVSNEASARELTDHLLDLGHVRIALLIDETDWTSGQDRYRGYVAALTGRGLAVDENLVVRTGWDTGGAQRAAVELLSRPNRPTAVFAANNVLAEGAWRALREVGLSVPGDISLVSFDDSPWMSMVEPRVTCAAHDSYIAGQVAIRTLLERLAEPSAPIREIELPCTLRIGGSTAAASA